MNLPARTYHLKHRTATNRTLFARFAVLVYLLTTGSAVTSVALAAPAVASGWTPARAATTIKAHYTTIDQKAYDYAKSRGLDSAMKAALHGAKATKAVCKTTRKTRFRCTATVQGSARIPPDYVLYTATVKLTVSVSGSRWRIAAGWR